MEPVQHPQFRLATLPEYLSSIPKEDIVSRLNSLLDEAPQVSISWGGKRVVQMRGFEGSVEINEIAKKYLQAPPFSRSSDASLEDRVKCYNLWEKVQGLYEKSDEELRNTWLFQYFVPLKEFRPWCRACAGDPQALIKEWDGCGRREDLFQFTPKQFREMWPNVETQTQSWSLIDGERWYATKEMVDEYMRGLK